MAKKTNLKTWFVMAVILLALLGLVSTALADDPCAPPWRGEPGSTYAEFTYDTAPPTGDPGWPIYAPSSSWYVPHPEKGDPDNYVGRAIDEGWVAHWEEDVAWSGSTWVEESTWVEGIYDMPMSHYETHALQLWTDDTTGLVWEPTFEGRTGVLTNFGAGSWDIYNFWSKQPAKDFWIQLTWQPWNRGDVIEFGAEMEYFALEPLRWEDPGWFFAGWWQPAGWWAGWWQPASWVTQSWWEEGGWIGSEEPVDQPLLEWWPQSGTPLVPFYVIPLGGEWRTSVFLIQMEPNPVFEYFGLFPQIWDPGLGEYVGGVIAIDQIVIDTICYVPDGLLLLLVSSSSGGTVTTPGEWSYWYNPGTVVPIVAQAGAGYQFVEWTGTAVDDGKVANPSATNTTVTMDGNYTLVANFARITTFFVDETASGNNDGTSWANAFNYIQDGLAEASSNPDVNEIWVAEGTYKPDENTANPGGTGSRTATFQLINGVALYGGFAGSETSLAQRNWQTNETILSGDLDGNDVGFTNNGDNSYHVVTGSGTDASAVLDGFTITAGNANGGGNNNYGGGMYNDSGSPTVTNCTFSGSSANEGGGGMCNNNGSPTVTNCTFSGNEADGGGGMYNYNNSSPTVTNCMFSGNSAIFFEGGGMYNYESNPTVTNCTFSGNSAGIHFGGGGMYNTSSSPTVTNCTFSANSAGNKGGGMCNYESNSPGLSNCIFSGNSAEYGGGMSNYESNPSLTNCTFSGNIADANGGGVYDSNSSPTLTNCILWGNTASDGNEIALYDSSTIDVNYCDIKGGQTDIYNDGTGTVNWGSGNIDEDPLFVGPNGLDGIGGTADDEELAVHLSPNSSPCFNAGDPGGDYSGQVDIDNQPRVAYGRVDMGADEVFPIFGDSEPDGDVDFYDFGYFANNWLIGVE